MASLQPRERCDYCGCTPCVGVQCPSRWHEDDGEPIGEWQSCWYCLGHGGWHDCGEDTCCCLEPEMDVVCDVCEGRGGWYS